MSMTIQKPHPNNNPMTSFNGVYAMNRTNLSTMQAYINGGSWSSLWQQVFDKASDYLTSIRLYPFDIVEHSSEWTLQSDISLGTNDTGATGVYLLGGYDASFEVGNFTVHPHFYNFLDYSPYTKIYLYLPYIGNIELEATEYMGKTISIKYVVDFTDGSCTAYLIQQKDGVDYAVLRTESGVIGVDIPWSTNNAPERFRSALVTTATMVGSAATIAAKGVGASVSAKKIKKLQVSAAGNDAFQDSLLIGGKSPGDSLDEALVARLKEKRQVEIEYLKDRSKSNEYLTGNLVSSAISNSISTIFTPASVERGGTASTWAFFYAPQQPYLIIGRPRLDMPDDYKKYVGKPLYATRVLNELSGYTVVNNMHCNGIVGATSVEVSTIMDALSNGVIL